MPPTSKTTRRRSFDKPVGKKCPACKKQTPVACKSCQCGHSFSIKSRNAIKCEEPEDYTDIKIRRTERTKRVPPDFFNSLEYGSSFRRQRHKKDSESSVNESPKKKKRGRPKGALNKPKSESDKDSNKTDSKSTEEDSFETLSTEKALQCSIILAELNRKFMGQTFKPV